MWEWFEGHAMERKGWQWCSVPKCMNNQANKLAKTALLHAILGGNVIKGDFPFELVKIKVLGMSVSGSPCQALESGWGYHVAQSLFSDKKYNLKRRFSSGLVGWSWGSHCLCDD
jgi:hypothetical protein